LLMFFTTLTIFLVYYLYCKRFKECQYYFYWNKEHFSTLLSYAGWSMFGGMASVGLYQATNILINIFFGPSVNAARGISIQLKSAVSSFSSNIRVASNPQIIKSYANQDFKYMTDILYQSTRFSYILMLIISVPLFIEMEFILKTWLTVVPEYTV